MNYYNALKSVKELLENNTKVIAIEGKSGCGKSTLLRKLKNEISIKIITDEEFIQLIVKHAKKDTTLDGFWNDEAFENDKIIAIEDIDFYCKKTGTLEEISRLVNNAEGKQFIFTGISLREKMKETFFDYLKSVVFVDVKK